MLHQKPFDRLDRHAGAGPGRGIARRHLAGIGKGRLESRRRLTVNDRHLMAGTREIVSRSAADDAAAEDQDFHALLPSRGVTPPLAGNNSASGISNYKSNYSNSNY